MIYRAKISFYFPNALNNAIKMNRHFQLLIVLIILVISLCAYFIFDDLRAIVFRGTQIDSIGHMTSFFLLTWLLNGIAKLPLINCMFTICLYAALTEFGQYYLGFRNGEISDFFADLVGMSLFALLRWAVIIYRQNRQLS